MTIETALWLGALAAPARTVVRLPRELGELAEALMRQQRAKARA